MQVVLSVSIRDTLRQTLAAISARDGIKLSRVAEATIAAGLKAQGELSDPAVGAAGPAGARTPG